MFLYASSIQIYDENATIVNQPLYCIANALGATSFGAFEAYIPGDSVSSTTNTKWKMFKSGNGWKPDDGMTSKGLF